MMAIFLALVVSLLAARGILAGFGNRLAPDVPNERSLHHHPVPRAGGLAVAAGVTAGWLVAPVPQLAGVGGIALALAAVSLLDDLRGLSVPVRLVMHVCAAIALTWLVAGAADPVVYLGLAALVVWSINLYNFMDGSDGLAGGMAVSGFGFYALAAGLAGDVPLAVASAVVAAAAAGFLVYNFPPARMFLGDSGAIPLGFLAVAIGLSGWQRGDWPAWLPALLFSPFLADASVTLVKRLARGERVWQAHREHYYQRLVRLGLGHHGTALLEYALMLGAGLVAIWALSLEERGMLAAVAWFAGLMLLMAVVDRAWARRQEDGLK